MASSDVVVTQQAGGADPSAHASDLCALLEDYLHPHQIQQVFDAYRFSAQAHEGQRRLSGEPYITHPLAVAKILGEMRLDDDAIVAAILHDVIEDTSTAKNELAERFGSEVAELVDGVSKLTQIDFKSKAEAQAENFRKMVMAMSHDIRVILIKLADRLHNMRTIWVMPPYKRWRVAAETLDIYAPIAHRLGMNRFCVELEDLAFAALYPMRYRVLKDKIRRQDGSRSEMIDKVRGVLEQRLSDTGIDARVLAREKHLWSIYKKMRSKRASFQDIFDVHGLRVIVDDIDTCYRALGVMHSAYKPLPGRIKDYIAIPKANGYQSLHTTLLGPRRIRVEVQIRTAEMDRVAESGIASHWHYKDGDSASSVAHDRAREWVGGLIEMQRNAGNPVEFIENVKVDLQPDEVYVFTPSGDIMELPRGATAVDFAYAVHSDIGDSCIAAMVDHRLTPLRTPLDTGQTVEIITAPVARPNPAWLDFVVTAKARAAIRHSLKRLRREEAVDLGRRLVDQALQALGLSCDELSQERVDRALGGLGGDAIETVFEEVGFGERMPWLVAQRLSGVGDEPELDAAASAPLRIRGSEGAVVTFARCCRPIPGDNIVGFASSGRGVVVHQQDCHNLRGYHDQPEKWLDVQWDDGIAGDFPVSVAVDVVNERGVLAAIAATVSELGSNIDAVDVAEKEGMVATIYLTFGARDRTHLARIMRRLRLLSSVIRISRRKE